LKSAILLKIVAGLKNSFSLHISDFLFLPSETRKKQEKMKSVYQNDTAAGQERDSCVKRKRKTVRPGQQDLAFDKQFIVFKQVSLIGMDHAVM